MKPPRRILPFYLGSVIATGAVILGLAIARTLPVLSHVSAGLWLIAALLVAAELFPILVPRGQHQIDEVTVSSSFGFALVIALGVAPAVFVQALASIVGDLFHRKPIWKIGFNVGAYAISLGCAGLTYVGFDGTPHVTSASLIPAFSAGLVFLILNGSLVSAGVGLAQGVSLPTYVARDLLFEIHTMPVLLALSPVIVVAADRSPWLVPLAAAPAAAVHWGTKLAVANARLVTRLQGSLDEMTELNRVKDDFAAVVSHELRTPLTSIQGYIKTMLQLSNELDETERRSFLEAADRQSHRLRRLIEQLLVVARLESRVEPLIVSSISLSRVIAHVVDELQPQGHGHTFDIRIPPDHDRITTDEGKLHQILSNLVENALKYSPPDTRVTIGAEPSSHGVTVRVQDEGLGIPEHARDLIFNRFYQVDQSTTRRVGGTGLGLYICRRMAETLGARVWLARSDATGSEFSLFLPEEPPKVLVEREGAPDEIQSITASV